MGTWVSYRPILGLSTLLSLLPVTARADFIIEFTDGHQVTVGRYVDEGRTITIYTPQGAIGFRKEDVKRITEAGANQSADTPLETLSLRSSSPTQASAPDPSDGNEAATSGKATEASKGETAEGGKATEAESERIDTQYQDLDQQFSQVWEKHLQDVNSGASEEVLTENRRRLAELDQERHKLIKAARQANTDDQPDWAQ